MIITFLLTNPPNPRMQRRALAFNSFADCRLSCIRRKSSDIYTYDHNLFSKTDETIFEVPPSTSLFKRFAVFPKILDIQQKSLKEFHPDVIYVQGIDCLLAASIYKLRSRNEPHIVYEVADLREAFFPSGSLIQKAKSKLICSIEKILLNSVSLVVATSGKFLDLRYRKLLPENKLLEVPNMPILSYFQCFKKKREGEFVVGYVGVLRYINQMKLLCDAAKTVNCRVVFSGEAQDSCEYRELVDYSDDRFVTFSGRYDYAKEIASIYGGFDCVYAVYDAKNPNVQIALPNKLYEAVWCGLPLIVSRGTYLGEIVERLGVGIAVDCQSEEEIANAIRLLSSKGTEYNSMVAACERAKSSSLFEDKTKQLSKIISCFDCAE